MKYTYDIIVVGAGHAGCEAATVAATLGAKVLLITLDMNNITQLSCNPAMGGIAKGQIVREIDALGGRSAIITDDCTIQFRMLNRSKGPAMWSPRAQLDRMAFVQRWIRELQTIPNLDIKQDVVSGLIIENGTVKGVTSQLWGNIYAPRVIITVGTFLNGMLHFGSLMIEGGRISEKATHGITEQLAQYGVKTGRMKTGTPPRISGKSVDFTLTTEQPGDEDFNAFSFLTQTPNKLKKRSCYILYTNEECHTTLRNAMDLAPIYNGQIKSIGPRYCPSIESKIVTFADKTRHQLFLEPEGEHSDEFYLNGFSSSLPLEVQLSALRTIPALKNVEIFRPGYAIEYDFFDPTQLKPTLESMVIKNLYLAGQINGTTGYEEAAGQGIMAGINATLSLNGTSNNLILLRDEAYIGVLIDDLITKGIDEPYRMFTSRAEYRTLLRQDSTDERLTPIAIKLGIASSVRTKAFENKCSAKEQLMQYITNYSVKPNEINNLLQSIGENPIQQGVKLRSILLRPNLSITKLIKQIPPLAQFINTLPYQETDMLEAVEVKLKYEGYIERERLEAEKLRRLEHLKLGNRFNYLELDNISIESRQKLDRIRPETLGQASRIPGVSPHDISVLMLLASGPSVSREK